MFDATSLFVSMLIGTIGMGLFMYGKRSTRVPQLLTGLLLMIGPYFTANVTCMLVGAALAIGALSIAVRMGL